MNLLTCTILLWTSVNTCVNQSCCAVQVKQPHTHVDSVAVKKGFFVSGEFLLRYRAVSAIYHRARLNGLDRAKRCGKVRYKSSGLCGDAWPQIRPACCLDASVCNLQGSRLSDSCTAIGGKAQRASGHACLCGWRKLPTPGPSRLMSLGLFTFSCVQYFQSKHEWSAFSRSASSGLLL